MNIIHRISINSETDGDFFSMLIKTGLDYKAVDLPGNGQLIRFVIAESDPHWPPISKLVEMNGAVDIIETTFAEEELRNAEWLRLKPTFEQGYPQPKSHWPIKQLSYDIICPVCAVYRQINPMRLAKEPSLRGKSFMSLIWAAEIFCTPEVILGFEEIQAKGYEAWKAILHKSNQPSERVRQLYVPNIASPGLIVDDNFKRSTCPVCKTTKYFPHVKGTMYIKREALPSDIDFVLTNEWFGHGLLAWREILVSNRIGRKILDKRWKGIRLKAIDVA